MLWVFLSKDDEALEIKLTEFRVRWKSGNILWKRGVDREQIQNDVTQQNFFEEYTHFVFENYSGKWDEITKLFEVLALNKWNKPVLITKHVDKRSTIPFALMKKLKDEHYWLYSPTTWSRIVYLENLLKVEELSLPRWMIEILKKEGIRSCTQTKGVVQQLKLLKSDSDPNWENISEDKLRELIKSNNVVDELDDRYSFLGWLLEGDIKSCYLLLKRASCSSAKLQKFMRAFVFQLNRSFWEKKNTEIVQSLAFEFLLLVGLHGLKMKEELSRNLIHFLWANSPKCKLSLG
ncbi:hypothetical protein MHLP_01395 [Candidatus Mycoplasma haematolamae str. Purdue]|uniref:DNA polymerase III subunit delta n=1 Tax=Mycoplasma haematolamae (strain Purdue) TaxID=1212765 RepID=I7CJ10_MYCHA|nr:hypothetical protein [Candidatus Mycoplasma haematolamae]AFO51859.1 hypothetical protein MHLP_01395 [Candidatus Mycoplasma haematolamae str. Purdue]